MTARQFFFFFKDCSDLRAITCFCLLAKLMQISTWSFQVKKEQEFQNSSPCWSTYMYLGKTPCLECIIRFQNHGFLTLFWSPHSDVAKNFLFLTLPGANRYLIIEMLTPLKEFDQKISNVILMAQKVIRHSLAPPNVNVVCWQM